MDNEKIELVKSYTLLRYSDRERNEMYFDFQKVLIKHRMDARTRYPIEALLDFMYKWFNELPIFPSDFDELNKTFPFELDGIEKEYL